MLRRIGSKGRPRGLGLKCSTLLNMSSILRQTMERKEASRSWKKSSGLIPIRAWNCRNSGEKSVIIVTMQRIILHACDRAIFIWVKFSLSLLITYLNNVRLWSGYFICFNFLLLTNITDIKIFLRLKFCKGLTNLIISSHISMHKSIPPPPPPSHPKNTLLDKFNLG